MIKHIYRNTATDPVCWYNVNDVLTFEGLKPLDRLDIFHADCGPYTLIVSLDDPADPSVWCWSVWDDNPTRIITETGFDTQEAATVACEEWYRQFLKDKGEA